MAEYTIKNLKELRVAKLLTQKELSEKSGVSRPTLILAEGGGAVSLGTLRRLAVALGVKPEKLVK